MNESWLPLVQAQRGRWMQIQIRLSGQPLPTPSNPFLHTSQSCPASAQINQTSSGWSAKHGRAEIKPSQHTMILFCRPIVIIISVYMTGLAGIASHNHPSSLIHLSPSFFSPHFLVLSISLIPHQWEWGWVKFYHILKGRIHRWTIIMTFFGHIFFLHSFTWAHF